MYIEWTDEAGMARATNGKWSELEPAAEQTPVEYALSIDNWPRYHVDYLPRFTNDGDPRTDWRDTACGMGYNADDHMRYYDWEHDVDSVRHGDGTECSDRAFCKNV